MGDDLFDIPPVNIKTNSIDFNIEWKTPTHIGTPLSNDERREYEALKKEFSTAKTLAEREPTIYAIKPKKPSGNSESVAVIVWSDWHIEERVRPEQVLGRNEYSLTIARQRFDRLLQGSLRWYQIASHDTTINEIILALLGDFITGAIHADLSEGNEIGTTEAISTVEDWIINGIEFLLKQIPKNVRIIIPCHSGNHGRSTKEQRIATEPDYSWEWLMYDRIAKHFRSQKRVTVLNNGGINSIVDLFGGAYKIRFAHGQHIKYSGGVGGLTVPVKKAIPKWNSVLQVNLDVFGHFHQHFDGGSFIANGSMIGYNAYAMSINADFEMPSQTFFLINREYNDKVMVAHIFLR
jgi:hypothetical protein